MARKKKFKIDDTKIKPKDLDSKTLDGYYKNYKKKTGKKNGRGKK